MRLLLGMTATCLLLLFSAPASAGWAIAYSPSTGHVSAWHHGGSTAGARKPALEDCGKVAGDCEIAGEGWNGCFAFARAGKSGKDWAVGRGDNVDLARADALGQCGGACKVEVNFCDRSGGFRPEYQSCRQYEVWQQAVASHGTRSEAATKVCTSLIQSLVKQGKPICICN